MEAVNRNKRFCSDKCRVYWNRENLKPIVLPEEKNNTPEPEPEKQPKEEFSSFNEYRKKKMGLK